MEKNTAPVIIDCDVRPFVPKDLSFQVHEHKKGGQFKWDPRSIGLYWSSGHTRNQTVIGTRIRTELLDVRVLNANILDFLLKKENRHLIPVEWRSQSTFFWGTIYTRPTDKTLWVRCLHWNSDPVRGKWDWHAHCLSNVFEPDSFAAFLI